MKIVRNADGLLAAEQTCYLLHKTSGTGNGISEASLLLDLNTLFPGCMARARNTIAVLLEFGVLEKLPDGLSSRSEFGSSTPDWRRLIGDLVAQRFADDLRDGYSAARVQGNSEMGGIWLDRMLLSRVDPGLPLWLLEFDVVTRSALTSRFWRVEGRFESLFIEAIREGNSAMLPSGMSLARLEAKLSADAENGKVAEEWVLRRERGRLADHRLLDQVRIVSDEVVSAGFDILSFSSFSSLKHDLFLEVKSYGEQKHFYWSENEIIVAKEKRAEYALCLVDRRSMSNPVYRPQIIRDPYWYFIESDQQDWHMTPASFHLVAMRQESDLDSRG